MTISMYKATVPSCIRALQNLDGILSKGLAHAQTHDIDPVVLLNARLYPDMLPLSSQVQIATDIARRGGLRLAGQVPESVADTETTFEQLQDRIQHAIDSLSTLQEKQFEGSEDRAITFKIRGNDVSFDGQSYLLHFILPNVFFHSATAYDILRHNGVPLGKADFLGSR